MMGQLHMEGPPDSISFMVEYFHESLIMVISYNIFTDYTFFMQRNAWERFCEQCFHA